MTKHAKKPLAFGSKRPKPTFICTGFLKKLKKNYFEENGKNGLYTKLSTLSTKKGTNFVDIFLGEKKHMFCVNVIKNSF